jgi:hypothetical protein
MLLNGKEKKKYLNWKMEISIIEAFLSQVDIFNMSFTEVLLTIYVIYNFHRDVMHQFC